MNNDDAIQGVFDFDTGHSNGFENWLREEEARMESIRKEWRVPALGKQVRIRLQDFEHEFTGKLELAEYPPRIDRRLPLPLRINRVDLFPEDIVQCIILS